MTQNHKMMLNDPNTNECHRKKRKENFFTQNVLHFFFLEIRSISSFFVSE